MKKRTSVILTIAIAIVGFSAFHFNKKKVVVKVEQMDISEASFNPAAINTNFFPTEIIESKKPKKKDGLDLFYMVKGKYSRSISEGKLKNANYINEIIPEFPKSWIDSYNWVDIATKQNDQSYSASGENGFLTNEQKHLLKNTPIDNAINITLKYKTLNSISKKYSERQMKVSFTVVPETKAEFAGGYDKMISYLKEKSLKKIEAANIKEFKPVAIVFYVDENGKTTNLNLTNSCGNDQVNNLLIHVIKNMPKWKPAFDSNSKPVKQKFEFIVGPDMC